MVAKAKALLTEIFQVLLDMTAIGEFLGIERRDSRVVLKSIGTQHQGKRTLFPNKN